MVTNDFGLMVTSFLLCPERVVTMTETGIDFLLAKDRTRDVG